MGRAFEVAVRAERLLDMPLPAELGGELDLLRVGAGLGVGLGLGARVGDRVGLGAGDREGWGWASGWG